jgi:tetratricopeptide (TPR) repeat protein
VAACRRPFFLAEGSGNLLANTDLEAFVTTPTATSATRDEGAAATIREALGAARMGRFEEACSMAEQALASGGAPIAINTLLGMLRVDLGQPEEALAHLEFAHEQRPFDLKIATDLASVLTALERFDRVLEVASRERAFADPSLQLARIRGAVAVQLGEFAAAREALEHVLAGAPNDWETWNNLGNALRVAGEFEDGADAYERALVINPASAETRQNYASVLRELRRTEEAEAIFRELAAEFPDSVLPLRDLHRLLRDSGRDQEALEAIEAAVARAPDSVLLLIDKAKQLAQLQRMNDAEAAYRQVLEIDPSNADAYVGLAVVLELTNRTSELASLADEAEQHQIGDAVNLIHGFNYFRSKQYDKGLAALDRAPPDLEPSRRLHLQGQLLEAAGRYDEAFDAFLRMNKEFRADATQPEVRGAGYRDQIRRFHDRVTAQWVAKWKPETTADRRPAPVFLVGFPRSGTTLLDTMLMSHPAIEVLEEEPPLRTAMQLIPSFAGLPTMPDEEIAAARDRYFETVASIRPLAEGKLLVDKNPLTMNLLPFVRRLFPDARIILALRHPCDVVLSCFMANFRTNEGMSSFVRLDTAAELYDLSFSYYEHVQSLMALPTHVVLYEDIVDDRARELRALFDFLRLDWHDSVLDHQSTALKRGRIKTASYAQVVQPIYTRSAGRWRNYRKHLEPVLPALQPWIDKFGYSL